MTAQGPLSREQVEGAQAILAALSGLRTGGFATAGTAGMGQPSETAAGQPIAGGPQSMQPASPADLLGAIYGALNQQAAKVPGASKAAGLARQGSEALRGWAAEAPAGSDMRKSRETFSRLYDFAIPQDELGALLAVIPPARITRGAKLPGGAITKEVRTLSQVLSEISDEPNILRAFDKRVNRAVIDKSGTMHVGKRMETHGAIAERIGSNYDDVTRGFVADGEFIPEDLANPTMNRFFSIVEGDALDNIPSKELAHRLLGANPDDAVDILEELQRRGYDPDLAKSIPLDRRTPPEPGRRKP